MLHALPSTLPCLHVARLDRLTPSPHPRASKAPSLQTLPMGHFTHLPTLRGHRAIGMSENPAETVDLQRETGQRLTSNSHAFAVFRPDSDLLRPAAA
jgi:hypothetical protein